MISLQSWLEANKNQELCDMAADIAFDAIKGYWDARDMPATITNDECKARAEKIAFARRRGWDFEGDANDPAGDIARAILADVGFRVASGSKG